ncbi:MAG TPA: redoxin domain-containing protein [Planctomycetota bacterium]|nr:redoxin domain-containing protein [Planctomycetota bacterium]
MIRRSVRAFLLLACGCAGPSSTDGPAVRPADLPAVRSALEAARGKPLVVNHWATWCAPCVAELPVLSESARTHEGRVRFLGVSWDRFTDQGPVEETVAKVRATARRGGLPYETLLYTGDPEALWEGLGLSARTIPQTFVFDGEGREIARFEEEVGAKALEGAIRRARGAG